jgi:hypothetical protein
MLKKIVSVVGLTLLALALTLNGVMPTPVAAQNFPGAAGNPSVLSRPGGTFYAPAFFWQGRLISGNTATGSQSVILVGSTGGSSGLQLTDGTTIPVQTVFSTLTPVVFDLGQGAQESVTPTAVSVGTCPSGNLGIGGSLTCVTFTGSFVNTHGQSAVVADGTFGLQTAINYASQIGSGVVSVDTAWRQMGGTNAMLTAAIPYHDISIMDTSFGVPQFWNAQGGATAIATPATLIAATAGFSVNGANLTGGFYTGNSTYIACIAYVDIAGQEGPCSASFTIATSGVAATDQIGFTAPAASTGAVGYTIYITLASGAYTSAYKVPLVSQPTVVGVYPVANGVCTLTQVETITPACALGNVTYAQTGSGAVVSALTLNTSPIEPQASIVSTTSIFVPNPGGRTAYTYTPGNHIGMPGMIASSLAFPVSGSAATTVPTVLGTVNLAPGVMNFVGRTLEICGKSGISTGSTTTILTVSFQWDSMGQNTAGAGVTIGTLGLTPVAAFSTKEMDTWCEDFMTTAVGATATGGSINTVGGFINTSGVSTAAAGQGAGSDPTLGATASLNLAADARINVVYTHTTGTFAPTLQGLTVKVLN